MPTKSEYILEPFVKTEIDDLHFAPRDLFDKGGRLLLAKGQSLTPLVSELLLRRQVYTLRSAWYEWDCALFSQRLYREAVTRMENLYRDIELVDAARLAEIIRLVDDLLAEVVKDQRLYIELNLMRSHDNYTYVHSVNVALLSSLIGREMGLTGETLRQLVLGALLHDLGKVKIPAAIINKSSALSDEEYAIIRQHPEMGLEMLREVTLPDEVLAAVVQHHERWNGKGYPARLKSRQIDPFAQIVAVADVFDAVAADRPYRPSLPPYHAIELVINGRSGDFAPSVLDAFTEAVVVYPRNSTVTLSSGETGVVVDINPRAPTRPRVQVLFDPAGRPAESLQIIDLLRDLTTFIIAVEYGQRKPWDVAGRDGE
ncbi:MAG TPA: HD-GYP domain-containing protein [Negativicutes bacterium]|nr:HD-GYP domain-containing protein [Negativicutes bacterium]